jgi:hypothetical protein
MDPPPPPRDVSLRRRYNSARNGISRKTRNVPKCNLGTRDAYENPRALTCAAARVEDMPLREKAVWGNFIIHVFVGIFLIF